MAKAGILCGENWYLLLDSLHILIIGCFCFFLSAEPSLPLPNLIVFFVISQSLVSPQRLLMELVQAVFYHLLHINPGNSKTAMPTWRNEAPDTCVMPSSTLPNMSAFGTRHFLPTLLRNGQKASITMSLYPMPPRSWCG